MTVFEETPIVMSTYLVGLVVADFKCLYTVAKNQARTTIGACAMPDKVEYFQYGLDVAQKALEFYEDLFNVSYPLSKLGLQFWNSWQRTVKILTVANRVYVSTVTVLFN